MFSGGKNSVRLQKLKSPIKFKEFSEDNFEKSKKRNDKVNYRLIRQEKERLETWVKRKNLIQTILKIALRN